MLDNTRTFSNGPLGWDARADVAAHVFAALVPVVAAVHSLCMDS